MGAQKMKDNLRYPSKGREAGKRDTGKQDKGNREAGKGKRKEKQKNDQKHSRIWKEMKLNTCLFPSLLAIRPTHNNKRRTDKINHHNKQKKE